MTVASNLNGTAAFVRMGHASGPDMTACDLRLLLASPIPDGDIATLHLICTQRAEQIHQRGHSPDADAQLPLRTLPNRAARYIGDACEYLSLGRNEMAVLKLLKAGALILAAIARIRMEITEPQP